MSGRMIAESSGDSTVRNRREQLRWAVRTGCFIVAVLLTWFAVGGAAWLVYIGALSPFVALSGLLADRTFHAWAWPGLLIGVAVLFRHRLFCRWLCPLGLCADAVSAAGKRLGSRPARCPAVGRWIVWLTVGGAILGWPLLLWLDPLAIWSNGALLGRIGDGAAVWLPALGLLIVLAISAIRPHLWCRKICPLGALQDQTASATRSARSAIFKADRNNTEKSNCPRMSRRGVLGIAAGAGAAWLIGPGRSEVRAVLRPPGARDESRFVGLCTRCGNCLRVCPSRIIRRDMAEGGAVSLFTPVLRFDADYCREDCTLCTQVCPSGAIMPLSVKAKADMQIGLPAVDMNICLLGDDRECSACMRWCPYDAIRYVFSEAEYTLIPHIDQHKCTGCGACEAACPTKPKKAIVVERCDATA